VVVRNALGFENACDLLQDRVELGDELEDLVADHDVEELVVVRIRPSKPIAPTMSESNSPEARSRS
jgi:hypothetical protein